MDYSIDWLWDEKLKYEKNKGKSPYFLSDWDNYKEDELIFPQHILKKVYLNSIERSSSYSFMSSVESYKTIFSNFLLEREGVRIDKKNIAISHNSTTAIHLCIHALTLLNVKRFLVITPVYFSVLNLLKNSKLSINYFHLNIKNNFRINFDELEIFIKEQYIEAIIVTDPVFCTGIEYEINSLQKIVDMCKKYKIWLLYDYTLGGVLWNEKKFGIVNSKKIKEIIKLDKFIFIDSITKKLFLNGLKFSSIIANTHIIELVEDNSENFSGGLNYSQIKLFEEIYNQSNYDTIHNILTTNLLSIKNTYKLIKSVLIKSDFDIVCPNSSNFTIIFHKSKKIKDIDYKIFITKVLYEKNVLLIPLCRFFFYNDNLFGFRVNLSKNTDKLISAISKSIRVDL